MKNKISLLLLLTLVFQHTTFFPQKSERVGLKQEEVVDDSLDELDILANEDDEEGNYESATALPIPNFLKSFGISLLFKYISLKEFCSKKWYELKSVCNCGYSDEGNEESESE